jgi:acylphosphatase
MIGCHYLIYGKVQGVGFRAFTQKLGLRLGMIGWVRNLRDGRVEVLLLGDKLKKDEFESEIRKGPPLSQVDRLDIANYESEVLQGELRIKDFLLSETEEQPWSPRI